MSSPTRSYMGHPNEVSICPTFSSKVICDKRCSTRYSTGAEGFSLTVLQQEEVEDIANFEKELGIVFKKFKKADAQSIEENNGLLWAKKIFKTKPNREVSEDFKAKIKTIFHHLTKEELVDKILANYLSQTASSNSKSEDSSKKRKK